MKKNWLKHKQTIYLFGLLFLLLATGLVLTSLSDKTQSSRAKASESAILSIDPEVTSVGLNEPINVNILVNPNSEQITTVQVHLNYDPTLLELTDVSPGTFFTDVGEATVIYSMYQDGEIIVAYSFPLGQDISSDKIGHVINLEFYSLAYGQSPISFQVDGQTAIANKDNLNVLGGTQNGYINIVDPTIPSPSSSPTPTATPPTNPTEGAIKGRVIDNQTGNGVSGVTVVLEDPTLKGKNAQILGTMTESDGSFDFTYRGGEYNLFLESREFEKNPVPVTIINGRAIEIDVFAIPNQKGGGGNGGNGGNGKGPNR